MIYCSNCGNLLSSGDRIAGKMYIDNKCACYQSLEFRIEQLENEIFKIHAQINSSNSVYKEQIEHLKHCIDVTAKTL